MLTPLLLGIFGTLAVTLVLGSLAATVWLALRQSPKGRRRVQEEPEAASWGARVAALEVKVDSLPGLWEEERRRAEAARDRERYYATKSRRRRPEADEDAEEPEGVPGGDAAPGGEQGVLPLLPNMGGGPGRSEPDHVARARALGYPWTFVT